MKPKLLLGIATILIVVTLGCAQVPQEEGWNGGNVPEHPSKGKPQLGVSADVAAFIGAAQFPLLRESRVLVAYPEEEVVIFQVSFGEPQDCESGCFYSAAWGLKNKEKISWLKIENYDEFDPSSLPRYDFDARDAFVYSREFRQALRNANAWVYHHAFLSLLFEDVDARQVWREIATEFKTVDDVDAARLMLRSILVQKEKDVVEILADLPGGTYGEVRSSARALLGDVPPFIKMLQEKATKAPMSKSFVIEADDNGFYPPLVEVSKGDHVALLFKVREENVYYGGLLMKSKYFSTGNVVRGGEGRVSFVAPEKDFAFMSYWPSSNARKAEGKVRVVN